MSKMGLMVKFKTSGYEVADVRNPNPPATAWGRINGMVVDGYVPIWCERENREPTTIYVHKKNIIRWPKPVLTD